MKKLLSVCIILCLILSSCFSSVSALDFDLDLGEEGVPGIIYKITELDGKYKTQGRSAIIGDVLMTDYTASGIEFNANCEGMVDITFNSTALISGANGGCYYTVIIDGVKQPRDFCHITQTGDFTVTIADDLPKAVHNFKIYRQTEIEYATIGIKSISLDGEILDAPEKSNLYIEFVGSSSTCGFGNLGDKTMTTQEVAQMPIYEDGTQAFSYLTAEALGADYSIVARQGTGCYYSWQKQNMLTVYPLLRAAKDSETPYEFKRKADIVVLGLGGNDVTKSASLNTDSDPNNNVTNDDIVNSYIEMFNMIKDNNPNAKILWVCNMTHTDTATLVNQAVAEMGGAENGYYALTVKNSNIDGAKDHPSAAAHKEFAEEVTAFIKENILDDSDANFSNIVGNSIRSTGNQGLRFKYKFDTESILSVYNGYEIKEIGAIAIRTDYLQGAELLMDKEYLFNGTNRKAVKGVFYNSEESIDMLTDEGIASALLYNIGYNKSNQTLNFAAYDYNYSVRPYIILDNGMDEVTLYENTDYASVFAVMDAIIEAYIKNGAPTEGDLYNDYMAVQDFLNSTETDKNGKTINEIYTSR